MTPAELRIIVSVRAAEARRVLASMQSVISRLEAAVVTLSGSLTRLTGTMSSLAMPLKMTSAAAADLAKNLALIGKSKFATNLAAIGPAGDKATLGMNNARVASEYLTAALATQNRMIERSIALLTELGMAGTAAGRGAKAGANAAAAAAGAAASGKSASTAGKGLQAYSAAANTSASASSKASSATRTFGTELVQTGNRSYRTADGLGAMTQAVNGNTRSINGNTTTTRNARLRGAEWAQGLGNTSAALRTQGSQIQWAGRQMSLYFTAPMALAIGMGAKWQLDLEKQQTQLLKVYGDVNVPIEQNRKAVEGLEKQFRKLSDAYGISQEDITEIGAAWAQAGKSGQALATYTKLTAEAMIIGDVSASQAAEGMQGVALQWGIAAKNAKKGGLDMQGAMAIMNMASNVTQVSFQDLFDGMGRVGSTARNLGFTFQETSALITTVARVTGSASTAGNGLKTVFLRMLKPTTAFKDQMKALGQDMDSKTWRSMEPVKRLQEIAKLVPQMGVDQKAAFAGDFGGVFQLSRALQVLKDLDTAGGNYQKVMANTNDATNKSSSSFKQYQQELGIFLDSNPQKFKIAGTMIKNSIMDIAVVTLPYILKFAQTIASMAKWFSNLNPHVQKTAIVFGLVLAAMGPLAIILGAGKLILGSFGGVLAWVGKILFGTGSAATGAEVRLGLFGRAAKIAGTVSKGAGAAIRNGIVGGFRAAAAAAAAGSETITTTSGAGSRAATAAWASGLAGMGPATAAAGAAANTAQARNNATFFATTRMGMGEAAAAQAAGMTIIEGEIIASGPAQAAAQRANMAEQAAAVRAGGPALGAAQAQAGRAQTAAAATGGVRAGEGAAAGASRGFKGRAAGLIATLGSVFFFIPKSWRESATKAMKNVGGTISDGAKNLGGRVKAVFGSIGESGAKSFGSRVVGFLTGKGGWIGAIAAAIIGGLFFAWDEIKSAMGRIFGGDSKVPILARPFIAAFEIIRLTLSKLPEVVVAVFRAVVNTIVAAAKAVYRAFSYINPFAHHSPSLVENVTKGMAVVTSQFADGTKSIQNSMQSAYADINKFGRATSNLSFKASAIKTEDTNKGLNRADPSGGAARAYADMGNTVARLQNQQLGLTRSMIAQQRVVDGLQKSVDDADKALDGMNDTLETLQKIADGTSKALDAAKDSLDYYANAPIKGMQAMSDAIFANEMAQKQLNLQIMDLEDAGQSIDDVTDKYAKLQGQLETLSGQREDLRLAGAGSDILGPLDKMIADLKAQQTASATAGVSEITKLNDQLDELKKKSDRLDLVNSLQFDPLTRQIEQLVNTSQELDFSTIVSGVNTYKTQVAGLTVANTAATAAVENQQAAIDIATKSRDKMNDRLDAEKKNLDDLNTTYGDVGTAIDDVNTAMSELTESTDTINQRADELAQQAKEAADAMKKLDDATGDAAQTFDDSDFKMDPIDGKEALDSADEISKELDDKLKKIGTGFDLGKVFAAPFKALGGLWDKYIWPELKNLPGQLVNFFMHLPGELASATSFIAGYLAGIFVRLARDLPLWVLDALKKGVLAIAGFVSDPGTWSALWDGIKSAFSGVVSGDLFIEAGKLGWRLIKAVGLGIAFILGTPVKWLYDNMIKPFIDGFNMGAGSWSDLEDAAKGVGGAIVDGVKAGIGGLTAAGGWVIDQLLKLPGEAWQTAYDAAGDIGGGIIDGFKWIIDNGIKFGEWIVKKITDLPSDLSTAANHYGKMIMNAIGDGAKWALNAAFDFGKWLGDKVKTVPGELITAANNFGKNIGGWIKDGIKWTIENAYDFGAWMETALQKIPTAITNFVSSIDWIGLFSGIFNWITDPNNIVTIAKVGGTIVAIILGGILAAALAIPATMTILAGSIAYGLYTALEEKKKEWQDDIGNWFKSGFDWVINNLTSWGQGIIDWFHNLPQTISNGLGNIGDWLGRKFQDGMNSIAGLLPSWAQPVIDFFKDLPNKIGEQFGKLGGILKAPINFVIETVYDKGLRPVWNNTVGKVIGVDLPYLNTLAEGGTVQHRALGGRITGPGTGTSDSIMGTAKVGSEVFTAREVKNAGGFRALEKMLGISAGGYNTGMQAPVALSNGEFTMTPEEINRFGGYAQVKKLRAALDKGGLPQHDIGDTIADLPGKATKSTREAAGDIVKKALTALGSEIPDEFTPPGGDWGKLPKGVFEQIETVMLEAVRGRPAIEGKAGNLLPGKAKGGTIGYAAGGTVSGSAAAAPAAAAPADSAATGTAADGTGLVDSVTAATAAASAVWAAYIATTETATTTFASAQIATYAAMQVALVAANDATNAALAASDATYNANQLVAVGTQQTTLLGMQTAFATSYTAANATMNTTLVANNDTALSTITARWTTFGNDLNTMVSGPMTDTLNTFGPLMDSVVGWFDKGATDSGTMWEKIKPGVAEPSKFVINEVYNNGIRGAWSKVHTWLDLPELEAFTAGFASGGAPGSNMVALSSLSNPNSPKDISNGGALKAASGSRDSTLFAGMRGEYVLNKDQVKQWGGIGQLESWRKNSLKGTKPMEGGGQFAVPGFAVGGALGKPQGNQSVIPGVIQEVPKQLARWKDKPYDYGGGGTPGYDCSGWTGAVHKILLGQSPLGRIWTTESDFASFGYKRGKDGYWSIGVHNGGGGMNSHTAGTLAGTNYESGGAHNTSTWGGPAAGTINPQFENQYYLPSLGGSFVGSAGGGAYENMTPKLLKMWDDSVKPTKDAIAGLKYGGAIGQIPSKSFDKYNALRGVIEKKGTALDAKNAAAAASNVPPGPASAGVERWRGMVQGVLRDMGLPLSYDSKVLYQMQTESGGNPNSINNWDSNAAAGHPSKGLMQVIDSTFAANMDPRYANNIWDPQANVAASIKYAIGRYGSLDNAYRGVGYDSGGWLPPSPDGMTTYNDTGKPEAVLTNSDWNAIYAAANNPVDMDMISAGMTDSLQTVFDYDVVGTIQSAVEQATETGVDGANASWVPQLLSDANTSATAITATTAAVNGTTTAVTATTGAVTEVSKQVTALTGVMTAFASAAATATPTYDKDGKLTKAGSITFASVGPLLTAIGSFIDGLPDAKANYVSWAGTNANVTPAMQQEKTINDLVNYGKGAYMVAKTVAPPILKHTAIIGTAIEQLVTQDAAAWTTGIGLLSTGNPMGALTLIPVILKEIFTVLPLIINAIMDIVPAIFKAIKMFFTGFMPDSVYSYDSYDAANKAATANNAALKQGATAPYYTVPQTATTTQAKGNDTITVIVYGGVNLPNVTNESGAENLATNLQTLTSG